MRTLAVLAAAVALWSLPAIAQNSNSAPATAKPPPPQQTAPMVGDTGIGKGGSAPMVGSAGKAKVIHHKRHRRHRRHHLRRDTGIGKGKGYRSQSESPPPPPPPPPDTGMGKGDQMPPPPPPPDTGMGKGGQMPPPPPPPDTGMGKGGQMPPPPPPPDTGMGKGGQMPPPPPPPPHHLRKDTGMGKGHMGRAAGEGEVTWVDHRGHRFAQGHGKWRHVYYVRRSTMLGHRHFRLWRLHAGQHVRVSFVWMHHHRVATRVTILHR